MKITRGKVILFILLIVVPAVVFVIYKNGKSFDFINNSAKHEMDLSMLIKPKNGKENVSYDLQKLDSAIYGKKLSLSSKVKVYDYKRYVYEVFINDYKQAHLYADSALSLIQGKDPANYKDDYAMAYLCKGDVYYSEQKFNEAFAYYYKAKQLGLNFFDNCINSEYNYRIGMIYYKQGLFEDAKDHFFLAFNEAEACPDNFDNYHRRQQVLSNVGLSYYQNKHYDSALYYYNAALAFIETNALKYPEEKNIHQEARAVVWGNMGNVYRQKNNIAAAKAMFMKNIEINLSRGFDIRNAQYSYLNLAELLLQENKLDSAYLALKNVKQSMDTVSSLKTEADWNRLMWQYSEKSKNNIEAYKYLKEYLVKKDEWIESKAKTSEIDLKKQLDLFEKQHKVETLVKDNEVKNLYLFITVFISVVVLALLIFLWFHWRKSRKNVVKLNTLNKAILSQNKELENALSRLSETGKEKEKLLNLVVHDLRAPLASLTILCDLVKEEKDENERNKLVELMKISSVNGLNLIGEILENNVGSKNEPQQTTVSINSFITECATLLEILAAEKQIRLVTNLPKEKLFASLNVEKFKRVINNLVTNAIKFSSQGSKINLSVFVKDHCPVIAIEDKGIGIPDNMKDKIFDLAAEFNRLGTEGEQSYGLGLAYCKEVVEEHGGKIWLESTEGQGSTFFIQLPGSKSA